ncbi:MAG: hypothetical protein HY842_13775 [Bacteroidetes bacterium]|nr:hypothetical protein [Bacteroidota bacterium]
MKKTVTLLALTLCLTSLSYRANAQWDLLSDLFGQMDSTEFGQFSFDLAHLENMFIVDSVVQDGMLDSLFLFLGDSLPGVPLDFTFFNVWGAGEDSLLFGFPGSGLGGFDQDTLLGEFDWINDVFNNNFDSLGGLFGQYQDSLQFDPTVVGVGYFDDAIYRELFTLQDTFFLVSDTSPNFGLGDMASIFGKLFDPASFMNIELAFGVQKSSCGYYLRRYDANASVIRVGTVPKYNTFLEARWHLQGSWTNGDIWKGDDYGSDALGGEEVKFTPLLFRGDFAIMLNPGLVTIGNTSFRLLTSLGLEFGTYAPSHFEYQQPFTTENKGNTTGFGPQAGAGFAVGNDDVTVYSMGTMAYGHLAHSKAPSYRYNSLQFEAGVRFKDIINVRYSNGRQSWQPDDNRVANVKNQVTVGIILKELHH